MALIESDKFINLIEQPEYKRRWNLEPWDEQEKRALRNWLLDRLEGETYWSEPHMQTTRTLANKAQTDDQLDSDEVAAFAFDVWNYKQGEQVSIMIHIGHRLGLYGELNGAGPTTAAQLAAGTGLDERWLREWLEGQAAAGLLERDPETGFELSAVGAAVLADE